MDANNKFKSSIGSRYLNGLFFERTSADKATVLYTLKNEDHNNYPSLYRLYMEFEDVTEWEFANTYLDGWDHWTMLCDCTWFSPYILRWRRELELKLRARALKLIRSEAESDSKNAYYANKFLLEGGWKEKSTTASNGAGRPLKAKDTAKDEILAHEAKQKINRDFDRIQTDSAPAG